MLSSSRATCFLVALFLLIILFSSCSPGGGEKKTMTLDLLGNLQEGLVVMDAVDPGHPTCRHLLGKGWRAPERKEHAWTRSTEAVLFLPVTNTRATRLALRGYGLGKKGDQRQLEILVNGYSLGTRILPLGSQLVEWEVPPHRLRSGLNEVALRLDRVASPREMGISGDNRKLGVFVDWLGVLDAGQSPQLDVYRTEADSTLAPGQWRAAYLPHGAGSRVDLTWEGESAPAVQLMQIASDRQIRPLAWQESGTGKSSIILPADCQPGSLLLVGGVPGTLVAATLAQPGWSPNVMLIVIDTLRPDYLACYGAPDGSSPHIDQLAADGILFETALCHIPITGPSHANLFTSRYPSDTGVLNNGAFVISDHLTTMAEILAGVGYDTRAAVSISTVDKGRNFDQGFQTYNSKLGDSWILPADTMYARMQGLREGEVSPGFFWAHFSDPHEPYDAHGLVDNSVEVVLADEVLSVVPISNYKPTRIGLDLPAGRTTLQLRSGVPFQVRNLGVRSQSEVELEYHVSGWATEPVQVDLTTGKPAQAKLVVNLNDKPDEKATLQQRYAREVTFADRYVGKLLEDLKAEGAYDETLIIFLSDHGEALGEHDAIGHVGTLYDVMMRIPLIIKPPAGMGFSPGTRRSDQAAVVDVLPTLLGLLEMSGMPGARGRDLLAAGAEQAPTAVFMETHKPESQRTLFGLRTDTGKVIFNPDNEGWEYYDLKTDPGELENLAGKGHQAFEEHRNLLWGMLARFGFSTDLAPDDAEIDPLTAEMLRSLGY